MPDALDQAARLRAWSYCRQLLDQPAAPLAALARVVAVYSSHPTAPLALHARARPFDAAHLAGLEEQRAVLRLPAMRQSIFLLPAETAPRIVAATRPPLARLSSRLRYAGLDAAGYERLKALLLERLRQPVTPGELRPALGAEAADLAEARIMTVVRLMAYEGLVLRLGGSPRTDNPRYVATDAWLGRPLPAADPAQALAWLAAAYLDGYGPARVADFAWWSGVPKRQAAAALQAAGAVDTGDGLLLPAGQADAFAAVEPVAPDAIAVLPKWDAYTMGYAPDGRQRLVDDRHLARAYSTAGAGGGTAGDGLPLVLRGGRAVATWSHRFAGNRLVISLTPFPDEPLPAKLVEPAFDAIGRLLDAATVELVTAP